VKKSIKLLCFILTGLKKQFNLEPKVILTIQKDKDRMKRYENRHKVRENWTKTGINTAGFWSKWILWNKQSLLDSIKHAEKKFNITIKRSKPKN